MSENSSFNKSSLSSGTHSIYFKVKDSFGRWSAEANKSITYTSNAIPSVTINNGDEVYISNATSVNLTGKASASITGGSISKVEWKNEKTGASGNASGTTSWTATIASIDEGESTIKITATDSVGNQGSKTSTVQRRPIAPTNLEAKLREDGSVSLSWTDNSSSETNFAIYRKKSSEKAYSLLSDLKANVTTYSDTTCVKGNTYNYAVFAYNSNFASSKNLDATSATYATIEITSDPDKTAPTGIISISGGNNYATTKSVTLSLSATDAIGVRAYYVNNATSVNAVVTCPSAPGKDDTNWQPIPKATNYSANIEYSLPTGNALKGVCAWFKDGTGNVSSACSDAITLDTASPTPGTLTITGGTGSAAGYTSTKTVTLGLSASDNLSGVKAYYASEDSTIPTSPSWTNIATSATSYTASVSYTLSSGNGLKNVYVWFRDAAGNISSSKSSASITLSTGTSALPSVTINSGDEVYIGNATSVNLTGKASANTTGGSISKVEWKNEKTGASGNASGTTSWTTSTILIDEGDSTIKITATDSVGNQGSKTSTVKRSPIAPTNLTAKVLEDGSVSLNWTNNSSSATNFAIYRKTGKKGSKDEYSPLSDLKANVTTYSDTTRVKGNTYSYAVFAYNSNFASSKTSGRISDWAYATIEITSDSDATAPTGIISINGGNNYATTKSVTLSLSATDAIGVRAYYVNNATSVNAVVTCPSAPGKDDTNWQPIPKATNYSANIEYSLPTGNALKGVCAWFKDGTGNVSSACSDAITLDTASPTPGTLTITGGTGSAAGYTSTKTVTLGLSASDNLSGVKAYYASEDSTIPTSPSWTNIATSATSYTASVSYTLSSGNGLKNVYVWFRDAAGNISSSKSSASITLSTGTSALPSVTINSGDEVYIGNATSVNLTGKASANTTGGSISKVEWKNEKTGASGNASGTTSWTTSTILIDEGDSTIKITATDSVGNQGSKTSTVKRSPIAPTNLTAKVLEDGSVSLNWTNNSSSATNFAIYRKTGKKGSKDEYSPLSDLKANVTTYSDTTRVKGNTYSYAVFAYNSNFASSKTSGRISDWAYATIEITSDSDATAPTGIISINGGNNYATTKSVTLSLSATDAIGVRAYYVNNATSVNAVVTCPSAPGKDDTNWQPIPKATNYSANIEYSLPTGNA